MLYHLKHIINDQQELINYLNSLFKEEEHHATIHQFRDQIMQLHANVEDLIYEFVEFLNNDSLYLSMIINKEE
jgi:histone deacetylase complex regulatory component SIN3